MLKDKKNIAILFLILIILVLIAYFFVFSYNNTSDKLQNLIKQGYEIKVFTEDGFCYIVLKSKNITISRISTTNAGDNIMTLSFKDNTINNSNADMLDATYQTNVKSEMVSQYLASIEWLKSQNISVTELSDILGLYFYNNPKKTEPIKQLKKYLDN